MHSPAASKRTGAAPDCGGELSVHLPIASNIRSTGGMGDEARGCIETNQTKSGMADVPQVLERSSE
jgi:hypothetical protein